MDTGGRRGEGRGRSRGRGRFERFLFSFMGPPQVGDVSAPVTVVADPAAALCHRCATPWEGHERVSTSSMTYTRCPSAEPGD